MSSLDLLNSESSCDNKNLKSWFRKMEDEASRLSFEKSKPGKRSLYVKSCDLDQAEKDRLIPERFRRKSQAVLPELTEPEVVRHFVNLSRRNYSVDTHFYPLGSCTMKYNPKINEDLAAHPYFAGVHPLQPIDSAQGTLQIFYELEEWLKTITGMDRFSLQPAAGAQGELLGMMIAQAYFRDKGEVRRKVIVPDSSHGTNPASAALFGFEVVTIPSGADGRVDVEALYKVMDTSTACLMLTNPNTLGLFETEICEIAAKAHELGVLLYYDGANMNALMGLSRPGDMGFDIMHLNLHKTFSTPHGGGGPGAGPVGVKKHLEAYLPVPLINKEGSSYSFDYDKPQSVGKLKAFYGNSGMLIRAYAYMRRLGSDGLMQVSRDAVLNANYLKHKLDLIMKAPNEGYCMHEFVTSALSFKDYGVTAMDVAKRLLDFGFYAPTVYFPLIVKEALMIEPTESESKETLDRFLDALAEIAREARENPEVLRNAPHTMPIHRPDEVLAARKPLLTYRALVEKK